MTEVRRHNPVLRARLAACLSGDRPAALPELLDGLSNMDFRTAGYLLSEELLPGLESSGLFWTLFCEVVPRSPKAYLGTFLKAAAAIYLKGRLDLTDNRLCLFSRQATPIDSRKILETFLPIVRTDSEVRLLLRLFCSDNAADRAAFLFKAGTTLCYYRLFQVLKTMDNSPDVLRRYCILLMRKGDRRSFNLAGILCRYFDIANLPGTFSLRLQPYQQSRLDESFDSFCKILNQ